jgi:hypothetical protein
VAGSLYAGTADDRFRYALDRLLDGIAAQSPRRERRPTARVTPSRQPGADR